MKLHIQIGADGPTIFPIKQKKLQIGSSEASDIHLPSSAGISRKHLTLTVEGDKIFICDMGSTNGTFINEERLQPGTKEEFTSFFPAKLGDSVWISLITDDNTSSFAMPVYGPKKEDKSNTKTMTLSEVNKTATKTKNLMAEKEALKKTAARPISIGPQKGKGPSDSSRMYFTLTIVIGLIGFVIFYHFYLPPPEGDGALKAQDVSKASPPAQKVPENRPKVSLVPEDKTPTLEQITKAFVDFKCTTPLEKKLCNLVPDTSSPGGVLEDLNHVLILVPEEKWYAETFVLNPRMPRAIPFTPEKRTIYLSLFFLKSIPAFDWNAIEKNIFFVFYRSKDNTNYVSSVIGIVPQELTNMLKEIPDDLIQSMTEKPGSHFRIDRLGDYMRVIRSTDETSPPPLAPETTQPVTL